MRFKISKLGVDLYQYFAESDEIYKNNEFFKFSSKTNQNKKQKYVNIAVDPKDKNLIIDGFFSRQKLLKSSRSSAHGNHKIVKTKSQISAISGRIIEQKVTFIGKETLTIGDKTYETLKFNFKSSDETLPKNKNLTLIFGMMKKPFKG